MRALTLFRIALSAGALGLLASCEEMPVSPSTSAATAPAPQGFWQDDGFPGEPKIVVSIAEQRAYFYKGKHLVGQSTVSTGKPGFGTPPGQYKVVWKHADHVSTVFGDYVDDFGNVVKSNIDVRKDSKPPGAHYDGARMPFAMFFRGGYAMHQGYVPPYAASHGCIRLPHGMAEVFFNNAPLGTPVIVKQEAVMESAIMPPMAPAPSMVAPPAPSYVRSTAPAPVVTAPVRSPAPVLSRAPAPVSLRSPTPAPRSVGPAPVRSITVRSTGPAVSPIPVRSPAPVVKQAPAPVWPPAPLTRSSSSSGPVRAPASVRSPAPARVSPSPAPVLSPAPTPVRSRSERRVHKRHHRRSTTPSPTPTPSL